MAKIIGMVRLFFMFIGFILVVLLAAMRAWADHIKAVLKELSEKD